MSKLPQHISEQSQSSNHNSYFLVRNSSKVAADTPTEPIECIPTEHVFNPILNDTFIPATPTYVGDKYIVTGDICVDGVLSGRIVLPIDVDELVHYNNSVKGLNSDTPLLNVNQQQATFATWIMDAINLSWDVESVGENQPPVIEHKTRMGYTNNHDGSDTNGEIKYYGYGEKDATAFLTLDNKTPCIITITNPTYTNNVLRELNYANEYLNQQGSPATYINFIDLFNDGVDITLQSCVSLTFEPILIGGGDGGIF